jgi:hypothetical protein
VFARSATCPGDPFGEPVAGSGEVGHPEQRCGAVEVGVRRLPCGVEGGELFDERSVLLPAVGDGAVVEGEASADPFDPVGELVEHLLFVLVVEDRPADRRVWGRCGCAVQGAGAGGEAG